MQKKMTQTEVIINKIAQGKIDFQNGISWFSELEVNLQKEIIQLLEYYILQAHPDTESIELGIKSTHIKDSMTPIVILKTAQNLKIALSKIIALPDSELIKSFTTLISIFKIADKKRREVYCKNGCSHEWHNLTDN